MKFNHKLILITVITFLSNLCSNAQAPSEILQDWTSYSQSLDVSDKEGYEFRVSVAIRVENITKSSKAALWVRVDKKDKTVGFFQNDIYATNLTDKWQVSEIKGTVDTNASSLNIGVFCQNNGDFYFDDFKVEVKKGNEKWKTLAVGNSGFEETYSNERAWRNGLGRNKVAAVKNFKVDYSNYKPFKGSKCLFIKGENILGSNKNGKYIDVNGVSLYYEIYGEGEPLLMIHGNSNSMSGFIGNVNELAKHYKVIFVDCRGRGNSTYKPETELTFDIQIDDLTLFLDKLNIEKTHIVGWSDGGILGLLMAIKHPERVNKLVAMAANVFPEGCADLDNMKKTSDNLVKENKNHKNDLAIDLYNLDINYPKLDYKDLSVIKSKTLIMAGDHDEIKNEHTIKMFEAIPGAQLAILPNETHYFPAQNPTFFNELVLKFLKS